MIASRRPGSALASEALPKLGERVADRLKLNLGPCHPPARVEYEREIAALLAGSGFRNLEWYIVYLYSQPACLLDYLPAHGLVLLDDSAELVTALADLEGQAEQLARDLAAAGDVPADLIPPYWSGAALRERLRARPSVHLSLSALDGWATPEATTMGDTFRAGPRFGGQVRTALAEIERGLAAGDRVVLVSRQAPRLADLLGQAGHAVAPAESVVTSPPRPA